VQRLHALDISSGVERPGFPCLCNLSDWEFSTPRVYSGPRCFCSMGWFTCHWPRMVGMGDRLRRPHLGPGRRIQHSGRSMAVGRRTAADSSEYIYFTTGDGAFDATAVELITATAL